MTEFELPARYYCTEPASGGPITESALEYAHQTLQLPSDRTALVLVDCWDAHPNEGAAARMAQVMVDRIAPVLESVRGTGITTVHAPNPTIAASYPQWTRYADAEDLGLTPAGGRSTARGGIDWPPREFRSREGEYEEFGRREENRRKEARDREEPDRIHPALEPELSHSEYVVAGGDQLHRLLAHRGLKHLLYAGFHTNHCIQNKDYGIRAMNDLGYNTILLRDCTQAYESHGMVEEEMHKQIAVRDLEMQGCFTATSGGLRDCLP